MAANLRNKVSKGTHHNQGEAQRGTVLTANDPAAAAKILKDLHERGEIEGRASGTYSLPLPTLSYPITQRTR